MIDECIHGLEGQRCDQCFPKIVPVSDVIAKPRSAPRATPGKRATVRRTDTPIDDVGEQRVYHLTHISNLASIIASGALLADAHEAAPAVDISAADNRDLRRAVVTRLGGNTVASYVPFFLAPDCTMFRAIRNQQADDRLTIDYQQTPPSDFVILVTTVKSVTDLGDAAEIAVTDGDATDAATRFAMTPDAAERMLRNIRAHKDSPAQLSAEFLVGQAVPFELVSVIGVANDRARDEVKRHLKGSAFSPKVSVYPPWFQREELAS